MPDCILLGESPCVIWVCGWVEFCFSSVTGVLGGVVSVAGLYDFIKFVAIGTNLFYHLINWWLGRGG